LFLPFLWSRLTPNQYQGGRNQAKEAQVTRNASAIGRMLGEFRTSMSDMILLKTESYLHGGVNYLSHTTDPELGSQNNHQADALIPSPEKDYRGWVGKLEREIKPWNIVGQHAAHTDGRQLLPWFRLATLSDPHHVHAYTSGGYWLSRHSVSEAIAYLEEGLHANPEAFQLYLTLGQVRLKQLRKEIPNLFDPSEAERTQLLAVQEIYLKAAELALSQRPHRDLESHPTWGHYDETDAWTAFRMSVILEHTYGSPEKAYSLSGRFLNLAGEDLRLQETHNNLKLELGL
jgi:hypothetical protein